MSFSYVAMAVDVYVVLLVLLRWKKQRILLKTFANAAVFAVTVFAVTVFAIEILGLERGRDHVT